MICLRKAVIITFFLVSVLFRFSVELSLNEFLTLSEDQKIKLDTVSG